MGKLLANPSGAARGALLSVLALVVAGTLLVASPQPAAAAQGLAKGFWGPTQVGGVSKFPVYSDLGVSIFQMTLRWDQIAPDRPSKPDDPSDPAYHWPADVDYALSQAKKHGMRVLLMLLGSPGWANGGHDWQWAPRPADYARFAAAASRRYPGVHLWMIWGEPSRIPNFQPEVTVPAGHYGHLTHAEAAPPRRYARLLDTAYGSLKARSKRNVVIGGNTFAAGDIRPVDWVKNMRLPGGKAPRLDMYGHNPFTHVKPDLRNPPSRHGLVEFSDLRRFNHVVDRSLGRPGRRHLRLFLSEFTVPTDLDNEFNFHVTPKTQATWITAGFRVARSVGAYGFGWVHLQDEPPRSDGFPTSTTGLIDYQGQRKPGYFAFRGG